AYPMAELQLGMVYEMERDPDRNPYLNVTSLRLPGRFDESAFRTAVSKVVRRHPALRTSFALSSLSEPMQLVHAEADLPVVVTDVTGQDSEVQRSVLANHVASERARGFDTASAPLCRMSVHVLSDDAFQWTVTDHHAILDGWSLASTLAEITDTYHALLQGEDVTLPPLRSTYRDYIAAERTALTTTESTTFWHTLLAERPQATLPRWPTDRPGHPSLTGERQEGESHHHDGDTGRGALVSVVPADLVTELETVAGRIGVPLKAVLLAAHLRVLGFVTGGADVVTGLSSNGRLEETDGSEVRGLFLNSLPFRLRLSDGSWADLARAVFAAERAALPHRRYPMPALQRALGGEPLFETGFVYNHFRHVEDLADSGRAAVSISESYDEIAAGVARTSFPLHVAMSREPGETGMRVELEYDARQFAAEQVRLLRDYHLRALTALAGTPDADHRQTDLLSSSEHALLADWNDTATPVPDTPVHELVAARATATPERTAVIVGDRSLTYAELDALANRLAHRLRDLGAGPETYIGVCLERSPELIVTLLAVLKAGGAYVPMDPGFPAARLEHMAHQADVRVLLVAPGTADRVPAGPWQTVVLDDTVLVDDGVPREAPENGAGPDNACYTIFTSGSTGLPKGVVTRHRNVTELLYGGAAMDLREDDTLLQIATVAFDVSTFEIWAPLVAGARLVLAPSGPYETGDLAEWIARYDVSVLHATASLFALLMDQQPQALDGLRKLLTGSETVSPAHVARAVARHPALEVVNCWGPTETTTFSVCGTFTAENLPAGPLPLGTPLANTEVWVLDETGLPVPVGSPGELYVSGPCLARGYLGNPALTAERFQPHPFPSHGSHARLYRTGDRGRWSVDGQIEFLGRVDHMVKIRGYRVEPGEVAAALGAHPRVRHCVVTAPRDAAGRADLVAYVVTEGEAPPVGELRSALRERLPEYMVPRTFVFLDELPLTPQGKVDRGRLPAPSGERPDLEVAFEPARPGVEERLAGIWGQVLGVDQIGRHDNFFDLGGDSIRSIQVLGKARDAGLVFGLPELFQAPTLAGLCASVTVDAEGGSHSAATATVTEPFGLVSAEDLARLPEGLEDAYPMAELQLGMVYEMERDPDRNPYHNVSSLKVGERFEEKPFRRALALVVARHAVLRTSFDLSSFNEPLQLVHARAALPLTVADLRGVCEEDQRSAIAEHVRTEERNLFPLASAPLCRMSVHVLSDDAFQWTVTDHHAILDGWSLASTLAEITDTYHALLRGEDVTLPPIRSTYRDYIAAERTTLTTTESTTYWHTLLAERPQATLPRWPAETRQSEDTQGRGELSAALPRELCDQLEQLAERVGVPVKSVLLAAHLRALSVAMGATDVVTGLSSNGRLETSGGAEVRGLFLNTVPLRLRLSEGTWLDLVRGVFEAEREMLPHRRYPMSALQRAFGGEPLFETGFVYNHFRQIGELAEGTSAEQGVGDPVDGAGRTHFPLLVAVSREPGHAGMRLELQYDSRELTSQQVALVRDYYVRVLEAMVADPDASYGQVRVLGDDESSQLGLWAGEGARFPVSSLHEAVVRRAVEAPDEVAVVCGGDSLTYAELVVRAGRVAEYLKGRGVGVETPVGVCVERSLETVVATLGVLLAGGVYVPLDTAFPADRMRFMLQDVDAGLVLTQGSTAALVPDGPWEVVDLDGVSGPQAQDLDLTLERVAAEVAVGVSTDHACYVIFTSGSTGRPKGTTVAHGNVTRLFEAVRAR
ncbi:non-ribosomal peptide synthetase, partial [Streptomyces apocyni]|uniref:non-ribosomal peptide synthetase n=1 Tax=Streptomyces apocyni TaxID=2654677 RepID=UPI0012EA3798